MLFPGDSFVLDVCDTSEDISIGQTLKRPLAFNQLAEEQKHIRPEDVKYRPNLAIQNEKFGDFAPKDAKDQSNFFYHCDKCLVFFTLFLLEACVNSVIIFFF